MSRYSYFLFTFSNRPTYVKIDITLMQKKTSNKLHYPQYYEGNNLVVCYLVVDTTPKQALQSKQILLWWPVKERYPFTIALCYETPMVNIGQHNTHLCVSTTTIGAKVKGKPVFMVVPLNFLSSPIY